MLIAWLPNANDPEHSGLIPPANFLPDHRIKVQIVHTSLLA
jgi:hypothetical protein